MKTKKKRDDVPRMRSDDFDRIMRHALGVSPEPKAKKKVRGSRKTKTTKARKARK